MEPENIVGLRERAQAAADAVRFWQAVVDQRVADAESLDGWFSKTLGSLMGNREQRVAAAEAEVDKARARLQAAQQAAEAAQLEHEEAEAHIRRERDAEVERLGALELGADQIRGTDHPLAGQLDEIERDLDGVRAELQPLKAAMDAGQRLLAHLNMAESEARTAAAAAERDVLGVSLTEVRRNLMIEALANALNGLDVRVRRFQEACAPLGVGLDLDDVAAARATPSVWRLLGGDLRADLNTWLHVGGVQDKLWTAREDVRRVVHPLETQHAALEQQGASLEARRRALLERLF